jgi:hypothetical protein
VVGSKGEGVATTLEEKFGAAVDRSSDQEKVCSLIHSSP